MSLKCEPSSEPLHIYFRVDRVPDFENETSGVRVTNVNMTSLGVRISG